jgi:dephospho-CoA kinase
VAVARARGDVLVVSDSPLVFEAGLVDQFDGILLVDAPVAVRRERLLRDRGLAPDVADAMIAAQWPSAEKRVRADWVIDNDGTRDTLLARVHALWPVLIAPPLPSAQTTTDITR